MEEKRVVLKKKRRLAPLLILLGAALLIVAASCFAIWKRQRRAEEENYTQLARDLASLLPEAGENSYFPTRDEEKGMLTYLEVNGMSCTGLLFDEEGDILHPIGGPEEDSDFIACIAEGTPYESCFIIEGPGDELRLGSLSKVREGDVLGFRDVFGRVFYYTVDRNVQVDKYTLIEETDYALIVRFQEKQGVSREIGCIPNQTAF